MNAKAPLGFRDRKLVAALICLVIGLFLQGGAAHAGGVAHPDLWMLIGAVIYGPLYLASIVLSIVAVVRRNLYPALTVLVSTLVFPIALWFLVLS